MKLGFATPISLRLMQDLVDGGEHLPVGYEFAPSVDWVRLLLRRGHELIVYTEAKDIDEPKIFRGDRLTIRIAHQRASGTGKDFAAMERAQLTRMMVDDRCDVIHAHWTYEFALAALASKLPTLITVHDLPWNVLRFFRDKFRVGRVLMAYQVALRGRYFTSVSADAAAHFHHYFAPWRTIEIVPNGLPDAVFDIAAEYPAEPRADITFGTILQGWSARKNASAALEAFHMVRSQLRGATLRMFGTDYEPGGSAERWAAERGIADGVVFIGKVPYSELLPRVSNEIDVLVHPSLDESFSMASLEAMALKKPVIAGKDTPGVREVLAYGEAGILLDVTNPDAISAAMMRLATEPAHRAAIASSGYEHASRTYRMEAAFAQYEKLYDRVLREADHG